MFLKYLKLINKITLLLGLIIGLCSCSILKKKKHDIHNLNTIIEKLIDRKTGFTPSSDRALLISVIQNNEIQTLRYPQDSIAYNTDLNNDSRFLIGGLSKVFVIALLRQLEKHDLLDMEDTFNSIIPKKYINPSMNKLRLKDLVNHHSGFPKLPNNMGSTDLGHPYSSYGQLDLLKYYTNFTPPVKIKFGYSHINYALIEIALETKFKLNLNQLLKKYLFKDSQLTNSFVYINKKEDTIIYPGFKKNGLSSEFQAFSSFGGALGMVTNMRDLGNFVFANLNSNSLFFDRNDMQYSAHVDHIKMQGGWYKLSEGNNQLLMHAGRSKGHYAFVAMCKTHKKAVIILSNSAKGIEFLGIDIIRAICH